MGVSDMYWASEEGKAEQTFTAGGYFFPGFATAYMFQEAEVRGTTTGSAAGENNTGYFRPSDNGHGAFQPTGHTTTTTTTAAAASKPQPMSSAHDNHDGGAQAQVWEVDSDEAEEIEEGHVNLLAGKGKARSRAGKKKA
jgi:hypothetical protein